MKKKYLYGLLLCLISSTLLASSTSDHYTTYLFPNHYDQGNNDTSALLPKDYVHILSLPFPNTKKVLRVYFSPGCGSVPKCQTSLVNSIQKERTIDSFNYNAYLFIYNPKENSSTYLGIIHPESHTGNSGALYVPYAVSGDNKSIILDAWMGSPGAGGGAIDYGYALLPISAVNKHAVINTYILRKIATRNAVFYDNFSRVIYIGEGGKTAKCDKPGPSNNAVIFYRNLSHPTKKKVLTEEPNTTYSNLRINEANKTVSFIATTYTNLPPNSCPQEVYPQSSLRNRSIKRIVKLAYN
jgi:hypothetical protein